MENFLSDIMISLLNIVINVNCRILTRINEESRILDLINATADQVLIRILQCVKTMVEPLPFHNQKKEIKELELCTWYLQPCFQKRFDSDDLSIMFNWHNVSCFTDTDIYTTQNCPDGCVENHLTATGYRDVKPIKHSKNHRKVNIDLHRLGTFAKTSSSKFRSRYMF
ncbi:uncharacterized protein EV154DRAFT_318988 [Mucor mucedo]|uniref:uncharacterized protein n=1 Tax=Mucor mucedo TaxID=29922 RepID=UPI00221E7EC9|nr:uncharacterized protein EV154DRAFT_318988 [Mucor mucedo]KAI7895747.1 hypothetical protein EV154DRAFT_318988 [Mucor mucedo]